MKDMLASNLAVLLKGDKATQTTIAEKVKVGQPTISKWSRLAETGSKAEPEFRKMARLARVLDISLDHLAWHDLQKGPVALQSQPARPDAGKLADLIETVEGIIEDDSLNFDARLKARVIAAIYANSGDEPLTRQAVRAALFAALTSQESP